MASSKDFVAGRLYGHAKDTAGFEYDLLLSDDDASYTDKFIEKYSASLRDKKAIESPRLIYIAFRAKGEGSHWTSAVLMLKRRKPRLFILDSIAHFSDRALVELSECMASYGGHTYLCCSGLQSDDDSCSKFTLDFLLEMAKLSDIFTYLVIARQHQAPVPGSKVTNIGFKDLPWQLIRNAQSLTKVRDYLEVHPECTSLKDYVDAHTEERDVKGRVKPVNTGIDKLFS